MKSILKIKILFILLLVAVSCNQNSQEGDSFEAKLENLRLASREDLVRLGELELNSSNVPVYSPEGERYTDDELMKVLESNQYEMDYYLDKDEKLGAVVLKQLEKPESENL